MREYTSVRVTRDTAQQLDTAAREIAEMIEGTSRRRQYRVQGDRVSLEDTIKELVRRFWRDLARTRRHTFKRSQARRARVLAYGQADVETQEAIARFEGEGGRPA